MEIRDEVASENVPVEPIQARGRERVAAILRAGADVFLEKGYHGATMSEIAERSHTAVGSLYRFFPNKDVLADALLLQFATNVTASLRELAKKAEHLTCEAFADALVTLFASFESQRGFATALVDARSGSSNRRLQFRNAVRSGMSALVEAVLPGLGPGGSSEVAVVLLYLLKGISSLQGETVANRDHLLAELRRLIRIYIENVEHRTTTSSRKRVRT